MRNFLLLIIAMVIIGEASYAQQQETITFTTNSFSFAKGNVNNTVYDIANVTNGIADCSQPGMPQFPVVYLKFIVPRNKKGNIN